jgi:hypothetical protein
VEAKGHREQLILSQIRKYQVLCNDSPAFHTGLCNQELPHYDPGARQLTIYLQLKKEQRSLVLFSRPLR